MIRWYITNDYSSTWYPICSSSHPGHSCRSLSKRPRHLLLSFSLSVPDLLTELLFTLETSSLLTPVQLVLTFLLQLVQFVLSPRAPSICAHFNFLSLFLLSFWHPSFFPLSNLILSYFNFYLVHFLSKSKEGFLLWARRTSQSCRWQEDDHSLVSVLQNDLKLCFSPSLTNMG